MLEVDDLTVEFGKTKILDQISFKLNVGEFTSIVGPNASGKSTLIKAINDELKLSGGKIILNGRDINEYRKNPQSISKWRAVLPQKSSLNFNFKVLDVIKMGRNPYYNIKSEKENESIAIKYLEELELSNLKERSFLYLSGGEQQRVQFARILAQMHESFISENPSVIFLDEPTSNLDIKHQIQILKILKKLKGNNLSVVIVIHDLEQALNFSDKIILLNNGRLVSCGNPKTVLSNKLIKNTFGIDNEWLADGDKKFLKINY